MPQIRVRVELFKGQKLIDLTRLSVLPDELNAFLQSVGEDAGLLPQDNRWGATGFENGSLIFSSVSNQKVPARTVRTYERIAAGILAGDQNAAHRAGATDRTLLKYVRFAERVKSGESVRLGLYKARKDRKPKRWYNVDAVTAQTFADALNPIAEYEGALLGIIHALYKESDKPHFDLRDIARNHLVKCFYKDDAYGAVAQALIRRDSRVHVSGKIRANRVDKTVESMVVRTIKAADDFSDDDFEKFIGCAPDLTGDKTAQQYISEARSGENGT